MNYFRLIGDFIHLFSFIFLIVSIWYRKSCTGFSGKTQILHVCVYVTRYVDLILVISGLILLQPIYLIIMKIIYIIFSFCVIYLIYVRFEETYDRQNDIFRLELLLVPVAILSLFVNNDFTFSEVLWTFSIYLEAVAILPQLFMVIDNKRSNQVIILLYVFALCLYRVLYICNWIYKYLHLARLDYISLSSGIIQVFLYFIYFVNIIIPTVSVAIKECFKYTKTTTHEDSHYAIHI